MRRVAMCLSIAFVGASAAAPAHAAELLCGATVSTNTKLTADIDGCTGDGLVIGADEIKLDLNGHTISGDGTNGDGIDFNGHNGVEVTGGNGKVKLFGIGLNLEDANGNKISGLSVIDNGNTGVLIQNTAFGNSLKEVTVSGTGNNGDGIHIEGHSNGTSLKSVKVNDNDGAGIDNIDSDGLTVKKSSAHGNTSNGLEVVDSDHNNVKKNDFSDNHATGVFLEGNGDTSVKSNTANHNVEDGIFLLSGSATLKKNEANDNGDDGIDAAGATDGGHNSAKGNGDEDCIGVSC